MTDVSSNTIRSPARAQWVAVVAVFGAVWGAVETSLGAMLRSASIPMHGTLMTGIGIVIMLVARRTLSARGQRGRGASLAVGVVAAAMLPLSVSRGMEQAMIGVLAEAACLEIVLWVGRPGRWRFGVAGILAALIPLVQLLAMLTVQYGPAALSTFRTMLLDKQGGARLGLAGQTAGTLVGIVVVVSAGYGLLCGMLAWSVAGQILRRLGREAG
jgi:hypothetical protein